MSFEGKFSAFVENVNPVEAQCLGKEPFANSTLARRVADRRKKSWKAKKQNGDPGTPYRCPVCRFWHVGPKSRKDRYLREDHRGPIR